MNTGAVFDTLGPVGLTNADSHRINRRTHSGVRRGMLILTLGLHYSSFLILAFIACYTLYLYPSYKAGTRI